MAFALISFAVLRTSCSKEFEANVKRRGRAQSFLREASSRGHDFCMTESVLLQELGDRDQPVP